MMDQGPAPEARARVIAFAHIEQENTHRHALTPRREPCREMTKAQNRPGRHN
jgi:hypothetical protein